MYYAHVKRLHSVKWRCLYGDTAAMQELLFKGIEMNYWASDIVRNEMAEPVVIKSGFR